MSRFATEQDVYENLGKLLSSAAADDALSARLQEADSVVQYRVSEPDATLTLDARKAVNVTAEFGETKLEPEIVLSLAADTAHDLFSGDLNLTAALASGQIATKGPVTKILRLLPVNLTLTDAPEAAVAEGNTDAPEAEVPEAGTDEGEPVAEAAEGESEPAAEADPDPA